MDRFQEMRVFAAVVDAGSFVGAADALGISKAAASRHVADLEARLGVRLLHRTTRRLSLTTEGDLFFARCKDVLQAVGEAEAEISERSGEAVGSLKISAPVSYGVLKLAPLWGGFMAAHPRIALDITLGDRLVDLVDEGFDMAVRVGRLASSSLVSRQLASTRLVLCASRQYLRKHGKPRAPEDLEKHAVLSYSLMAMGDSWQFTGPDGPVVVKVQSRLSTNSGDTCRAVALEHQGVILQPSFLVADDLRSGRLVELLPGYRSVELGIHAVYPSRKHLLPKVRLMVEYLARELGRKTRDDLA